MASFLIKDVRIFDGDDTIDNGSVLIENGKISKVSSSPIEYSGQTISKPGHTLIPGLIDVHIHADHANPIALPQSLRFGVTTVCDMHNEWQNILKLKEQMKGGDCADLKYTSFAATIDMGWPMPIVLAHNKEEATLAEIATWPKLVTPEDGRKYVQDRLKDGVHYIKLMHESGKVMGAEFNMPSLELQKAVIDEAHKHGLKVVAHATCMSDTLEMLDAGVDGMTHTFLDQPPNDRLIAAYKKANAHCNPTLSAMGSGTTEGQKIQEKFAHDPRVANLIGEKERGQMCMCMAFAKESGGSYYHGFETVRQLKAAGVPVLCGSDSAGPAVGTCWGLSAHQELYLFVKECGFSPEEALKTATSLAAERFEFKDRGRIAEGMRGDLVLIEGNPLDDIDYTLDIRGVWTQGELCSTYKGNF